MQVIDYLNELAAAGLLTKLCQAGVVNVKSHSQREIYLHLQALLTCPRYRDRPLMAATQTADDLRVHLTTVYDARKQMRKELDFKQAA